MEAFLAADARDARERLSTLLVITAVATQGERSAIERLQRALDREA
jgi:hypothetical protein